MKRQNILNEGIIKEFCNNNINIHFDLEYIKESHCSDIENLSFILDSLDCYIIGEEYCLSNYDMGCTIYNVYSDKVYILSFTALNEAYNTGKTLKLFANTPDSYDHEIIESWYN